MEAACALHVAYWRPSTLDGETPAMAAELEKQPWSSGNPFLKTRGTETIHR
jgi:hypothetical protein